jgi:cilia- and flagella-associated protein 57
VAKVGEEQQKQRELADLKAELQKEFEHMQRLIEEDADIEVDALQESYETRLKQEREATLRLKFENGIKRRTFTSLNKDVEDQKEEVKGLKDKQKEFLETIRVLEKDIQGHKKEIREREETIADKDRRIFDLKKRNQELEKFKFVLDYKIKELRRQIEPREHEIKSMRTQIEEMDVELEQYHKSNSALDLMIGELKLKMEGLNKEATAQQRELDGGETYLTEFRQDLQETVKHVEDYKSLKTKVRGLRPEAPCPMAWLDYAGFACGRWSICIRTMYKRRTPR